MTFLPPKTQFIPHKNEIYPSISKKYHYLCNRKTERGTTAESDYNIINKSINNKNYKIMDCIFRITAAVKKIGFVILIAELAVIAYMNMNF